MLARPALRAGINQESVVWQIRVLARTELRHGLDRQSAVPTTPTSARSVAPGSTLLASSATRTSARAATARRSRPAARHALITPQKCAAVATEDFTRPETLAAPTYANAASAPRRTRERPIVPHMHRTLVKRAARATTWTAPPACRTSAAAMMARPRRASLATPTRPTFALRAHRATSWTTHCVWLTVRAAWASA